MITYLYNLSKKRPAMSAEQRLLQQQTAELVQAIKDGDESSGRNVISDASLLQRLERIPVAILKSHQDEMGQTVLHKVIRSAVHRRRHGNTTKTIRPGAAPPSRRGFWSSRAISDSSTASTTSPRRHPHSDGLALLQYLVHCTDPGRDPDGNGAGDFTNEDMIDAYNTRNGVSCYNSLLRVRSAGGSLPLHTACRYLVDTGTTDENDDNERSHELTSNSSSEMLDWIEYLVQSYPLSVQCADTWGNLPLHEACDNRGSVAAPTAETTGVPCFPPLEVFVYLIQQWPESVRAVNVDGNLPLHLAAASSASCATNVQESRATTKLNGDTSSPRSTILTNVTSGSDDELCGMLSNSEQAQQQQRQLEIVQYLVDYWPDAVHQANLNGQTPLQCAQKTHHDTSAAAGQQRHWPNPLVIEFLQGFGEPDYTMPSRRELRSSINPFDDENGEASSPPLVLQRQTTNPFEDADDNNARHDRSATNVDFELNESLAVASNPFDDEKADCENGHHEDGPDSKDTNMSTLTDDIPSPSTSSSNPATNALKELHVPDPKESTSTLMEDATTPSVNGNTTTNPFEDDGDDTVNDTVMNEYKAPPHTPFTSSSDAIVGAGASLSVSTATTAAAGISGDPSKDPNGSRNHSVEPNSNPFDVCDA